MFALLTLAFACTVLGTSAAPTAQMCQGKFQDALLSANGSAEKCEVIRTFQYCLSDVDGDTQAEDVAATRAFKSAKCKAVVVRPRIVTRNDKLMFEVDSASDVILSRVRKDQISIVDLASRCEDAEKKVTASIATSQAQVKQGLDSAAATLSSLYKSEVKGITDDFSKKIADALKEIVAAKSAVTAVESKVNKAMEDMKKATDKKIADLQKQVGVQISKDVTGKIDGLEAKARCSFQGEYDAKAKTCKCDAVSTGGRCQFTVPKNCGEATVSGAQEVSPDGKNKAMAFCEAKIDGGKWDLMFHVAPAVAPALRYKHAFWTEKGKTMGKYATALEADFKSALFNTRKGNKELLIVAKGNKGKTTWGWGSYDIQSKYHGTTFSDMFGKCGTNCPWTGQQKRKAGNVKNQLRHNGNRNQREWGDIFIDHGDAVVVNKNGGWSSGINTVRVATTKSNGDYAHTFAGIGGHHEQGKGDWQTDFEAAPISSYCSIVRGYGSDKVWQGSGHQGKAFAGSCRDGGFQWKDVSFAFYTRG